ncbi:MAG: fructosamine kinase family protein [Cyclobacteriaceae bacterium]|nr:fructosamine kinase family protein [Cyclobacteriaceae bacterium HetDA_MAG_MS6]
MFEDQIQFFESVLFQVIGKPTPIRGLQFVAGGCINNTVKVETESEDYFIKWTEESHQDMFEKEERGISLLSESGFATVPEVLGYGSIHGKSFLVEDFISKSAPSKTFWNDFAQSLAALHTNTQPHFGLDHDNFIGRLRQKNSPYSSWVDFFIQNRLQIQLELCLYNNLIDTSFARRFELLYAQLPGLLPEERPSLLHGDLWSGNFMVGPEGKVYIFDPAVYYGNREIEMAFTRLFGGFDPQFYFSYFDACPVEPGFEERVDIYNLYPLLVHVNLFGTSYLSGIQQTINRYL